MRDILGINLNSLEPIGLHIEKTLDSSKVFKAVDLVPGAEKQNSWFVDYELVADAGNAPDAVAFLTVDGETNPVADGSVGRPIEPGTPYILWRGEHRRMRIIASVGASFKFIAQKYYYQEVN